VNRARTQRIKQFAGRVFWTIEKIDMRCKGGQGIEAGSGGGNRCC